MHLCADAATQPTNPGPSAIGVALFADDGTIIETISQRIPDGTNNVAEATAVLEAFRLAYRRGIAKPDVRTDSQLTVRQASGEYGVSSEDLQLLQQRIRKAIATTGGTLTWIPREENVVADALSKRPFAALFFPPESHARIIDEITIALPKITDAAVAAISTTALDLLRAGEGTQLADALADLRLGRHRTSTATLEEATFTARVFHGAEAVDAMLAALSERSPKTVLKALRWTARGFAPSLAAAKLRIEKAQTQPFRPA